MPRSRAEQLTPSLIEPVESRRIRVASVALLRPVETPYSYAVPDELAGRLRPGMRVTAPFGRGGKLAPGFCIEVSECEWDSTLRPIVGIVDDEPIIGPALLKLGVWLSQYYASPVGRTLDLMVPSAAKRHAGMRQVAYVRLARGFIHSDLSHGEGNTSEAVTRETGKAKRSAKADAILHRLEQARHTGRELVQADELLRSVGCTISVLRTLEKRGQVSIESRPEHSALAAPRELHPEPGFELNADQRAAIDHISAALEAEKFAVEVLYGVTGSGKTEVYVAAIRRALALGRQAVMLVPEIALTTQTVRRLECRFDRVATIHSGMTSVERSRTWAAVAAGEFSVVIGTRSAVFAPCPNLGLMIVDEEAEPSYKSQSAPRYHTRDVAVKRCHIEGIPIVLGSATPSLETWLNVGRRPHYHLLRLPNRVRGLALPTMHLVDMNEEHRVRPGVHMLSRVMEEKLNDTLNRNEQAVILLNRRGYASFLHCAKCRTILTCPHCTVRLVFHASTSMAHCHYCGRTLRVPGRCQNLGCDGTMVKFGLGTERVEEEIGRRFPAARVRRIDSDIMRGAADFADLLGAFERREFDVMVGTQMVAKGLDFPFVSFVGVISADTALALDDFRSEERTFQLVLQVAGRSGRGDTGGTVVVQTFAADTSPIRHAVAGDYEGFARHELALRREMDLPPWSRMLRIVLADGHVTRARSAAETLSRTARERFKMHGIPARVFEPRESPITRIRDLYRFDVLVTFPTADALMRANAVMKSEKILRARAKSVVVDVDPVSLQ
ncbi:MAG: primosomal protein N' [Phycisphaerae bacterium]|nr:primosomal protein N' [Phycisphaerae bacterium]